jgi:hypothetical protein
MPRGYFANLSISRKLAKPIERKCEIAILSDASVVKRFATMELDELLDIGIG